MQPKLVDQHQKEAKKYDIRVKANNNQWQIKYPCNKAVYERNPHCRGIIVNGRTVMDAVITPQNSHSMFYHIFPVINKINQDEAEQRCPNIHGYLPGDIFANEKKMHL